MDDRGDRIRVAHVLRSLEFGGAEKLVLELAMHQKESGEIAPDLICMRSLGPLSHDAEQHGLKPVLAGMHGIRYVSAIVRLMRIFSRRRPDVVHTHNFVSHVHAAPAAKLLGIPVIHTKHGKHVASFSRFPWLRRYLYNLSWRVAAVSGDTGSSLREKAGLDPSIIEVVYNGINVARYAAGSKREARKKLAVDEGVYLMGSVSRLDPVKDHRTMLEAFKEVAAERDDCLFMIIGDGPERERIKYSIGGLGLEGKVVMPGFIDDIPAVLPALDLFLQPSIEEGLSLTILEAAASRIPIIATPVGGTPEIIVDGVTGILVEARNAVALAAAMNRFLEDPDHFRKLANNAKQRIEELFSLEKMVSSYHAMYRAAIDERVKA
ncbi:MAG: glycosyltransferase [Candidatus Latescibacteria bacterium]|nr:glycosyltransferase [Candidatus Latescibacterota bacterium]NIM21486.1 glycosyltransferase [Candidatus Latescibacterota bacterium]NIM65657.1 glycosyltransferase [Candidatus Latescibacterota bacterium]NIO02039.1 glycosyltransferase [Candidatus Latescibacterota bacterium]NIO28851.1 glycosyltransferase [Candidatus Latescibacterota bacterium]